MGITGKPMSVSASNTVPVECCKGECNKVSAASPGRVEVVSFMRDSGGKEIPKPERHSSACIGRCFGEMMSATSGVCPADGGRVVGNSLARLEVVFYQRGAEVKRVCLHDGQCLERLRARRCNGLGITHPVSKKTDERPAPASDRFEAALRDAAEEPYASAFGNGLGGRRAAPMRPR